MNLIAICGGLKADWIWSVLEELMTMAYFSNQIKYLPDIGNW